MSLTAFVVVSSQLQLILLLREVNRAVSAELKFTAEIRMNFKVGICILLVGIAVFGSTEGRLEPTPLVDNGIFKLQNQHDGRVRKIGLFYNLI